jgi:hypothetical protein
MQAAASTAIASTAGQTYGGLASLVNSMTGGIPSAHSNTGSSPANNTTTAAVPANLVEGTARGSSTVVGSTLWKGNSVSPPAGVGVSRQHVQLVRESVPHMHAQVRYRVCACLPCLATTASTTY